MVLTMLSNGKARMLNFGLEVELMMVNTVHSMKKFGQDNTKAHSQVTIQKHTFNRGQEFIQNIGLVHIEHTDRKQVSLKDTMRTNMENFGIIFG